MSLFPALINTPFDMQNKLDISYIMIIIINMRLEVNISQRNTAKISEQEEDFI